MTFSVKNICQRPRLKRWYSQLINYVSGTDATEFVTWRRDLIKYLEGEITWRKWKLTIHVSRNTLGIRNGTPVRDGRAIRCFFPRRPPSNVEIFWILSYVTRQFVNCDWNQIYGMGRLVLLQTRVKFFLTHNLRSRNSRDEIDRLFMIIKR